jgi:hypothetical protein
VVAHGRLATTLSRAKFLRTVVEKNPSIEGNRRPAHIPELNPEERMSVRLKRPKLANYVNHDLKDLKRGVCLASGRIFDQPTPPSTTAGASALPD